MQARSATFRSNGPARCSAISAQANGPSSTGRRRARPSEPPASLGSEHSTNRGAFVSGRSPLGAWLGAKFAFFASAVRFVLQFPVHYVQYVIGTRHSADRAKQSKGGCKKCSAAFSSFIRRVVRWLKSVKPASRPWLRQTRPGVFP